MKNQKYKKNLGKNKETHAKPSSPSRENMASALGPERNPKKKEKSKTHFFRFFGIVEKIHPAHPKGRWNP